MLETGIKSTVRHNNAALFYVRQPTFRQWIDPILRKSLEHH
jgi:hypothetical protein